MIRIFSKFSNLSLEAQMKKSFVLWFTAAVFASLMFLGCDNDVEGFQLSDKRLSLTTFNARMTDDLAFKGKRFQKMRDLFAENDSEILCIQDLYGDKVMEEVRKMLKNSYGYDYTIYATTKNSDEDLEFIPAETIPAACSMNDLTPILSCVLSNCPDYDGLCIVQNCWQNFLELPADCRNCMLSNGIEAIQNGDYLSILTECQQDTRIPAKKLQYEFDGNSGVLLASKLPMSDKKQIKLRSYGRMRSAVAATVTKDDIGQIQVICSGLTPLSEAEYDGFGESWEDEQLTQIEQILAMPAGEEVVQRIVLGDFGGNLEGGDNILANNPAPVMIFKENGWYDPYFDVDSKEEIACTVCPENPFVDDDALESVPDHIFFRYKRGYDFSARRIFINKFTDFDRENHTKKTYSVSDHYGITAVMTVNDSER